MRMGRIEKDMSAGEVYLAITEADVGAAEVFDEVMRMYPLLEPEVKAKGAIYYLQMLDSVELYGESLYNYWINICNRRAEILLAVLRFYQQGRMTSESLHNLSPYQSAAILKRLAEEKPSYRPFVVTQRMEA